MPQNQTTTKIRYIPPSIENTTLPSVTLPLLAMGKLLSTNGCRCHKNMLVMRVSLSLSICSATSARYSPLFRGRLGEPHLWNIRYIPTRLRAHGNKPYRIYGRFRLRPSCSHRHSKSDQKHLDGILTRASEGPAPCSLEIPLPSLQGLETNHLSTRQRSNTSRRNSCRACRRRRVCNFSCSRGTGQF